MCITAKKKTVLPTILWNSMFFESGTYRVNGCANHLAKNWESTDLPARCVPAVFPMLFSRASRSLVTGITMSAQLKLRQPPQALAQGPARLRNPWRMSDRFALHAAPALPPPTQSVSSVPSIICACGGGGGGVDVLLLVVVCPAPRSCQRGPGKRPRNAEKALQGGEESQGNCGGTPGKSKSGRAKQHSPASAHRYSPSLQRVATAQRGGCTSMTSMASSKMSST